jgi:tRNA-uridine 2-sulfurtransferase
MRILVAMSGGVDSSTVAGLLHEAGHEVVGVTLQLYDHGAATGRKGACCAGQDIHDARRVADHLGISHYVIDAEHRFADAVIRDFADSYAAGETPVPCVRCNQSVKFTDLGVMAQGLGCERLATGHYVQRIDGPAGPELHRAADPMRDQSWFLFALTPTQLMQSLFPLGGMASKQAVRAEAERLRLPVALKPDSQDICFVPSGNYADTVVRFRPDSGAVGDVVSRDGRVLARHDGIARYTVALDPRHRRVIVGPRDTGTRTVHLRDVNWLLSPDEPIACEVKLRAREVPQPANVVAQADAKATVTLAAAALPAPGQACVFYSGSRILGGGIIQREQIDGVVKPGLSATPSA